jgi:hypothetical protein
MKFSASLSLAISSARRQDARAKFMNECYIKRYTPWLGREFEMLVFGEKGRLPLILCPTSGARYYENTDFGLVGAIADTSTVGGSQFTARTRSTCKVSTTNPFALPTECGPIKRSKT